MPKEVALLESIMATSTRCIWQCSPNQMKCLKKKCSERATKPFFPPAAQEPYLILSSYLVRSQGPHLVISKSLPNRHSFSQQALEMCFRNRLFWTADRGITHYADNPAPPNVISRRWGALNKLVFSGTQEPPQRELNL
jgi:hypothetical protein